MTLTRFFDDRARAGKAMVLITVFATEGSTYSKAGVQMLIDAEGRVCGLLSGGCLEGDLVERARAVLEDGAAATVSYDLSAEDELWGLGVGCDGTIHVLLQPLTTANGFQPFAAVAGILGGESPARLAIVVATRGGGIEVGASLLAAGGSVSAHGMDSDIADAIAAAADGAATETREVVTPAGECTVLVTTISPPPALLVLGAGPDARPLIRIAAELGWRCTVYDHRPAYVESLGDTEVMQSLCSPAAELARKLDLSAFRLAIIMSHHLASDREYLRQLASTDIGYIGLLGPASRRDRLLADLGRTADKLRGRLHGPAGLPLGGRGPAPIALSIIAEMQQHLCQRG